MKRIIILVGPFIDKDTGRRWWFVRAKCLPIPLAFRTKREAVAEGAKQGRAIKAAGGLAEMKVQRVDGTYSTAGATYGNDPRKSKG